MKSLNNIKARLMKYLLVFLLIIVCFYYSSIGFSILKLTNSEKIYEKEINSPKVLPTTIYNSFTFKVLNFLNSKLMFNLQDLNCDKECSNNCSIQSNYQKNEFKESYIKKCMEEDCSCILQNLEENSFFNIFYNFAFSVISIFTIFCAYKLSLKKPLINYSPLNSTNNELFDNVLLDEILDQDGEDGKNEENIYVCGLENGINDKLLIN